MKERGTPVLNSDDFILFAGHSAKAKLNNVPGNDILKKLDPVGTHVLTRSLLHGDGDFVRTWWYMKLEGNEPTDLSVEVTFDMLLDDYNKLARIRMTGEGTWEVVVDA
jgi:hypothetical protein